MPVETPIEVPETTESDSGEGQPQNQQGNLVTLPDGSRHLFPLGTSKEQMEKALGTYNIKAKAQQAAPTANWWDKAIDVARPFIAGAASLPVGVAAGTASAPFVGPAAPVVGMTAETQTYAAVDSLMKYLKTEKPKSFSEALTSSEMDAAINAVGGKLLQGVFRGVKAMGSAAIDNLPAIYKLAPTTSQALEAYGNKILSSSAKFLEDFGVPTAKADALNRAGGKGFAEALAYTNQLNGRTAAVNKSPALLFDKIRSGLIGGLSADIPELGTAARTVAEGEGIVPKLHSVSEEALNSLETKGVGNLSKLDDVIADRDKLAKVLKVGTLTNSPYLNVKQDLGAYKFMDMVNKAWEASPKGQGGRLNPELLSTMWNDPKLAENFKTLYGKEGMDRISSFFKDVAYTQTSGQPNKYINVLSKGSFLFNTGLLAHSVMSGDFAGMIPMGVQVGAHAVGKLLTNETTGRVLAEMAHGTLTSTNNAWASRMIIAGLKGVPLTILGSNGEQRKGTFVQDEETGHLKFQADK
jgi:hypothetical protein